MEDNIFSQEGKIEEQKLEPVFFEEEAEKPAAVADKKAFSLGNIFTIAIAVVYILPFIMSLIINTVGSKSAYVRALGEAFPNTISDFFAIFSGAYSLATVFMFFGIVASIAVIVFAVLGIIKGEYLPLAKWFGLVCFVLTLISFLIVLLNGVTNLTDLIGNLVSFLSKGELRLILISLFVFLIPIIAKSKKAKA